MPPVPDPLPNEDRMFGRGLFVDLVPTSGWFTNVRSCVDQRDWKRLRRMVVGRAGERCEACGAAGNREQGVWMEAHERWSYEDNRGVQRLRRLICLCTRCHRVTHFGVAQLRGQADEALDHLAWVNRWSRSQVTAHVDAAFAQWRRRSEIAWQLDLTMLTSAGIRLNQPPDAAERRAVAEVTSVEVRAASIS